MPIEMILAVFLIVAVWGLAAASEWATEMIVNWFKTRKDKKGV